MRSLYKDPRFRGKKLRHLPCEAIGTCAYIGDLYLRYARLNHYDIKKDIVLIVSSDAVNKQLLKMFSRVMNIVTDDYAYYVITNGGRFYLKLINKYWDIPKLDKIFKNVVVIYPECPQIIDFTREEIDYGRQLLRKIGVEPDRPFVVITNKDATYWSEYRGIKKPWDEYRYSDFNTTLKGIEFLKQEGYQVIRGGHYRDDLDPLPYCSLNSLTKAEKDFLDIFVQRECAFSMNGATGTWALPALFKKPNLMYNFIGDPVAVEQGLYLFKKLKWQKNGSLIPFSKLLNTKSAVSENGSDKIQLRMESADSFRNIRLYRDHDIEIIDNTEDEILDAIKEMLLLVNNNLVINEEEQHKFKKLFPAGYPLRDCTSYVSPGFMRKYPQIFK